jgi:cytochrome c
MKTGFRMALLAVWLAMAAGAQADTDMLRKYNCMACHAYEGKRLGPSFKEVAAKYAGQPDMVEPLAKKIKAGGGGVWGQLPMPAQPQVADADARTLSTYILGLK